MFILSLKPLYTFGTKKIIIKVHRFTNNFQSLQKVMVKDFSWNIIPWNALLFEKTFKQLSILDIENYGFILNTCHDTAKHAETRVGFPVIFSRLWWPIEPKFSQVCYFIYKLWYTKCGTLNNSVYRKCPMAFTKCQGFPSCTGRSARFVFLYCKLWLIRKTIYRSQKPLR